MAGILPGTASSQSNREITGRVLRKGPVQGWLLIPFHLVHELRMFFGRNHPDDRYPRACFKTEGSHSLSNGVRAGQVFPHERVVHNGSRSGSLPVAIIEHASAAQRNPEYPKIIRSDQVLINILDPGAVFAFYLYLIVPGRVRRHRRGDRGAVDAWNLVELPLEVVVISESVRRALVSLRG